MSTFRRDITVDVWWSCLSCELHQIYPTETSQFDYVIIVIMTSEQFSSDRHEGIAFPAYDMCIKIWNIHLNSYANFVILVAESTELRLTWWIRTRDKSTKVLYFAERLSFFRPSRSVSNVNCLTSYKTHLYAKTETVFIFDLTSAMRVFVNEDNYNLNCMSVNLALWIIPLIHKSSSVWINISLWFT